MRLLSKLFSTRIVHKKFFSHAKVFSEKYFITTPIYYLNAVPHIGHFYTNLLADVCKRWHALQGVPTHFSTGTDEHGLKVLKAAIHKEQNVQDYCDELSASFKSLFDLGDISYTSFVRTTDPQHIATVQHVWQELASRGYIQRGSYSGWYSVSDEAYVPMEQVEEVVAPNGRKYMVCSVTGNKLEWSEEENYMFELQPFADRLLAWIESGAIQPAQHLEAIKRWIRSGLPSLSISRSVDKNPWGIPVPGCPDQNVYVWLDALVNYLTVSSYYTTSTSPSSSPSLSSSNPSSQLSPHSSSSSPSLSAPQSSWWPPDCQVVGKDIIKFHAVYWPCFLLALGIPLPRKVLCHGHWMVEKTKMSKSRGNVVDPADRMHKWSSDALRYYLLKESSITSDADYSDQRAVECINADLVNTFGNLLSRSTGKSLNPWQTFPPLDPPTYHALCANFKGTDLLSDLYKLADLVDPHYKSFHNNKVNRKQSKVLEMVMTSLYEANAFFNHSKPWEKEQKMVQAILHVSMEFVRVCALLLQPIVPRLANKALDRLNIPSNQRSFNHMRRAIDDLERNRYNLGADTGVLLKRIKWQDGEQEKEKWP